MYIFNELTNYGQPSHLIFFLSPGSRSNDTATRAVSNGRKTSKILDDILSNLHVHLVVIYIITLVSKSILLRGIGNAFGIQLRMAKLWEAAADKYLHAHGHEDKDTLEVNDDQRDHVRYVFFHQHVLACLMYRILHANPNDLMKSRLMNLRSPRRWVLQWNHLYH